MKSEGGERTDEMSDTKGYRIPVWNELLEHHERMRDALWLFLWAIDRTTKEYKTEAGRFGQILGGMPLRDSDIAESVPGWTRKTVRRWRLRLVSGGYLIQKRTPYGHILEVRKSKKWHAKEGTTELPEKAILPGQRELPETGILDDKRITQTQQENYPKPTRELPETRNTKKTLQDSVRESSQTEKKMQPEPTLTLAGEIWKRLEIASLPQSFTGFIALAESVKPKPRETVAKWGQRMLAVCKAKGVIYPKVFLKAIKDAERSGDNRPLVPIPPGTVHQVILLERKVRDDTASPEERAELDRLRELYGKV
jgi:hypothetical protein